MLNRNTLIVLCAAAIAAAAFGTSASAQRFEDVFRDRKGGGKCYRAREALSLSEPRDGKDLEVRAGRAFRVEDAEGRRWKVYHRVGYGHISPTELEETSESYCRAAGI
jgi:hypothetical protein